MQSISTILFNSLRVCVNMPRPSSCGDTLSRTAENAALFFIYLYFFNPWEGCQTNLCGGWIQRWGLYLRVAQWRRVQSSLALPDVTILPGGLARLVGALHSHALVTLLVVASLHFALMYGWGMIMYSAASRPPLSRNVPVIQCSAIMQLFPSVPSILQVVLKIMI